MAVSIVNHRRYDSSGKVKVSANGFTLRRIRLPDMTLKFQITTLIIRSAFGGSTFIRHLTLGIDLSRDFWHLFNS